MFTFHPETTFGGDFLTETIYRDVEVECLIATGGMEGCFDDPEKLIDDARDGVVDGAEIERGWMLWPPIPYSYNTIVDIPGTAPSPPDARNWLGTDDTKRDVLARVI